MVFTLSKGYSLQFGRQPPTFRGVTMTVVGDPPEVASTQSVSFTAPRKRSYRVLSRFGQA